MATAELELPFAYDPEDIALEILRDLPAQDVEIWDKIHEDTWLGRVEVRKKAEDKSPRELAKELVTKSKYPVAGMAHNMANVLYFEDWSITEQRFVLDLALRKEIAAIEGPMQAEISIFGNDSTNPAEREKLTWLKNVHRKLTATAEPTPRQARR